MRWLTVMVPATPVATLLIDLDVRPRVIMRILGTRTRRSRWRSGQIPAAPAWRELALTCWRALLEHLQLKTSVQNQICI
jgi:hypothetical protein